MFFATLKATDTFSHDGDFQGKKRFIEKIDKNLRPLLKLKDSLVIITADHSTCCDLKRHCKELIPILVFGDGKNGVKKFSEKECKKGELGKFDQEELMDKMLKLAK